MPDLELIISGSGAENAVAKLAEALGDDKVELTPRLLPSGARAGQKMVDPIAVAALLVAIPGAILAVQDLADRIVKRRRAKAMIEVAERARFEGVEITIVTLQGSKALADLDADALLELVIESESQKKH